MLALLLGPGCTLTVLAMGLMGTLPAEECLLGVCVALPLLGPGADVGVMVAKPMGLAVR